MKRRVERMTVRSVLVLLALAAGLFCFSAGLDNLSAGRGEEGRLQLEESIRRAAVTCYAVEGIYPPTLAYLQEHYGIQVDENHYDVFYEVFGSNMMPDITVVERKA